MPPDERLAYDAELARRYSAGRALTGLAGAFWVEQLTRRARHRATRTVLDVGCGVGRFLPILHTAFPEAAITGVEPSAAMRRIAVRHAPSGTEIVSGALPDLPFSNARFDLLLVSMVLHHCDDPVLALAECARVATGGGTVFIRSGTTETVGGFEFLNFFPTAREKELRSMPAQEELFGWCTAAGLRIETESVLDQPSPAAYAEVLLSLRERGFPSLAFVPDAELSRGMERFARYCDERAEAGHRPRPEPVQVIVASTALGGGRL
jgi:ubiquinone/menaquinone biosynthesis C-methylase UbiE